MTANSRSSVKDTVIEKIVQLSDDSLQTVLSFVDSLIEQQQRKLEYQVSESSSASPTEELTDPKDITTWEQWFDELHKLPDVQAFELTNLTKQERRETIAEGLEEEYQRQLSTFPFKQNQ